MSLEAMLWATGLSDAPCGDRVLRIRPFRRQLVFGGGGKYPSGIFLGFFTSFYEQPVLPRQCGSELFYKCFRIFFGWLESKYGMAGNTLNSLIGCMNFSGFNISDCECAVVSKFDSGKSCYVECGRDYANQMFSTIGANCPKQHQFSLSRRPVCEAQFYRTCRIGKIRQIVSYGSWGHCE